MLVLLFLLCQSLPALAAGRIVSAKASVLEPAAEEASTFSIDFLDVGQGDAALVECDGHYMLIDGGKADHSRFLYAYLKERSIRHLDYIVASHPDEDHEGGLAGALQYATVDTALAPVTEADKKGFKSFVKYLRKQGKFITVPKVGETYPLGSAQVQILGPLAETEAAKAEVSGRAETSADGIESTDTNNQSIVMRIVYGKTAVLFTGDAELAEETAILESGADLHSDVLKVGHHGSQNSTSEVFLQAVNPEYAVISVGEDNPYGHPTAEVLERLRNADVKVYRTDLNGTVYVVSDGKTVSFSVEKDELPPPAKNTVKQVLVPDVSGEAMTLDRTLTSAHDEAYDYVLNLKTHKFHKPDCASVGKMKEKNTGYFRGTRDEVMAQGYEPCGSCKP